MIPFAFMSGRGIASAAQVETWYVDPGTAGGAEDGTSWANAYLSLNATVAARCNKTFTVPIRILCRTTGSTPDTVRVNTGALGQMVTSASNYLQIVGDAGSRPGTSWDASKYHLSVAFNPSGGSGRGAGVCFANSRSHVYVDGIQATVSSVAGLDVTCELFYTSEDSGNHATCYYSNLLIKGINDAGTGGQYTRGISVIYGVNMYNCIIYNLGSAAGSSPVKNHGSSKFYSCTFLGNSSSIVTFDQSDDSDGNGDTICKNCYAGGASFQDYDITAPATITMTNCASSDTTASGTAPIDSVPASTATFTSVTANSQDLALAVGSSLAAGAGANTSGDASPFNFTTDITGASRGSSWSIGAVQS